MNDYIKKTLFFNDMMFDLKGHIRSNKALYVYIFSSNNSSVKPLLSLYASLSFPSLSRSSSLFLFFPSPPHPYISLTSTLCLSIFSLSLLLLLSFSFSTHPPSTSASYPPYASLSFLSPSFFFSLFLTLTYVLMDNFLSLFLRM